MFSVPGKGISFPPFFFFWKRMEEEERSVSKGGDVSGRDNKEE